MKLQPDDRIGEYRILEVIGNGGFSVVYKAEDTALLRPVAVKQFNPEVFSEAATREWFIREARLAASLNHPNIVSTYALREQGDALFLVMEYLPGGDLHSLIEQNGPLDRSTLIRVASDVCSALETLHARNVIHRDIKPENILIAQEGHFKLADFGLAHIRQAHIQHTLDQAVGPQPGTLLYMSPEQAAGAEITVRSDIYSLAVVLYEAMTGHYYLDYDYTTGDDDRLLSLILHAAPIPPDVRHPSVPEELDEVLARALSKDPAERPRSARDFLSDLKNAIARSKRPTLSQKRRPISAQARAEPPDLQRELYAVRTLRDAEHQPDKALHELQRLWELYAGRPEVAAEWGETLIALGRLDEGRAWLERAVRLKPDLPFAQLALADLYRADGSDEEADQALVEAIHADPDLAYAVLYDDIVAALNAPDRFEHYVELFTRALDDQCCAPIYHNLAQVLALQKGREDESIAAFEAALALNADYGPAYVGLGSLLTDLDRVHDAIALLEQSTYRNFPLLPPDDWHKSHTVYERQHAFLALAVAYAQVGQYENSVIAACTVLDLDPFALEDSASELLDAYVQAAEAWIAAGEYLRAYKFLNQCIPLAAHWANVRLFALLVETQNHIAPEHRRPDQWEDAGEWLKTGLLRLQHKTPSTRRRR